MPSTSDTSLPSYTRPEVVAVQPDLNLVERLLGGTRSMWEHAKEYIQKWKDEADAVYNIRKNIETVFEGLGRTLSAAVGMLFAKAPAMNWNGSEQAFADHWANVDAAGTAGHVFVKRFAEMSIRDGLAVILVDHTPPPAGVVVHGGNERALGIRPTWAAYRRSQVISWRTAIVNNERHIIQLVLRETADVADGVFGVRAAQRWRVLRLLNGQATWTLIELTRGDGTRIEHFQVVGSGFFRNRAGVVANRLPVAVAYAGRTDAPLTATIPLLGVAWANLAHWKSATDLRFYRALCAFPQPVVKGELANQPGVDGAGNATQVPGKLKLGPVVVVHTSGDGDFHWAELTGSSLEQLEHGVKEKLEQMSQLGMAFLSSEKRTAETAEARRIDATAENSTLATAAQGIEDAVNLALEHHAWYLGIEKPSAPVMSISRDFESTAMDPSTMAAYVDAVDRAGLPVRLLLQAWQAGGRIPADADLEDIEAEMLAAKAARDEQKRLEREEALRRGADPLAA